MAAVTAVEGVDAASSGRSRSGGAAGDAADAGPGRGLIYRDDERRFAGRPDARRARSLLASLDGEQRELAARPFADDAARRWLEYRPRSRPGACLAELSGTARKAAHRLLATGLSEHAYAQAMGIVALEEVLDPRSSGGGAGTAATTG
jgi:Protein of unknown function (DUF3500).